MRTVINSSNESLQKRPALRLVKTNDMSREDWLEVRRKGIGSSDAAAAVGLNPYQSQLELWMVKTGRGDSLPQPDPNDDTSPMYWGTLLEAFVAAHYTKKTDRRVRRVNAVLQHPEYSWMLANLDREVIGGEEVQILECKTTGMNGARLWREGVPEYVQLQVMHQLAVTGKQAADVAVLVCGNDFRIHRIERDEKMISQLIKLEQQFWHYVETDTPPPADGSDSAATALLALYPKDTGICLDLSEDVEMSKAFHDLLAVRTVLAEQVELESRLKQSIQQRMGEASKATFGQAGDVTWRKSKDSNATDIKKLTAENPELIAKYEIAKPGSRRFLVQGDKP
jgi:putative phage-type endonuclease